MGNQLLSGRDHLMNEAQAENGGWQDQYGGRNRKWRTGSQGDNTARGLVGLPTLLSEK